MAIVGNSSITMDGEDPWSRRGVTVPGGDGRGGVLLWFGDVFSPAHGERRKISPDGNKVQPRR